MLTKTSYKPLVDARLSPIQWDAVLEGVKAIAAELPSEKQQGAAAAYVELMHARDEAARLT